LEKAIPEFWHFNCSSRETAERISLSVSRHQDTRTRQTTGTGDIAGAFATPVRIPPFFIHSALQEAMPPGAPSVLCL
jgi:hypothetical protein